MSIIQKIMQKLFGFSYYISELDQFIKALYHKRPQLSASQQAEKQKYERLNQQRDQVCEAPKQKKFWQAF